MGRRAKEGWSLVDLAAVVAAAVIMAAVIVACLHRPQRGHVDRVSCENHLKQIGDAFATYSTYTEYRPYLGSGEGAYADSASASLALLYPDYIDTVETFKCPASSDDPQFETREAGTAREHWTFGDRPHWSSYGYDPECTHRLAHSGDALVADMDGSSVLDADSPTANHPSGQYVLYFGFHVEWVETNCCSTDPTDNIFAVESDFSDPDTDAYIRR